MPNTVHHYFTSNLFKKKTSKTRKPNTGKKKLLSLKYHITFNTTCKVYETQELKTTNKVFEHYNTKMANGTMNHLYCPWKITAHKRQPSGQKRITLKGNT